MQFSTTIVALSALFVSSTSATWCNFYYDGACTNDANGGTSFDCANNSPIGSGGGFVKCHRTSGNSDPCTVTRFSDKPGNTGSQQVGQFTTDVGSNGETACVDTGGAGPWYELAIVSN